MQSMPALDGVLDRLGAVGVRGDPQSAPVRLVDDGAQLLIRIVLRACLAGQRHDPARTAHLDQLGAVLDLVAHRLADLVDAVGDALLDGQLQHAGHERREHRRVEVPARRGDRVPGGDHPRAFDPARVDRLAQRDVEQVTACLDEQSEVAHGGEPARNVRRALPTARSTRVGGSSCTWDRPGFSPRPPIRRLTSMSIRPGSRIGVAEIDDLTFDCAADADDPVVLDPHDARPDDLAGVDVDVDPLL